METDAQLRARILLKHDAVCGPLGVITRMQIMTATGRALDALAAAWWLARIDSPVSPDPFGDRIAEALRREDDVVPHPVKRVETEAEKDALWRSVEEYGRGG